MLHIVQQSIEYKNKVSSCFLKLPIKANVETKQEKNGEGKKRKKFGREKKKLLKLNGESLASRRNEVNVPSCASTQQSFVFIGPGARLFQDVSRPLYLPGNSSLSSRFRIFTKFPGSSGHASVHTSMTNRRRDIVLFESLGFTNYVRAKY